MPCMPAGSGSGAARVTTSPMAADMLRLAPASTRIASPSSPASRSIGGGRPLCWAACLASRSSASHSLVPWPLHPESQRVNRALLSILLPVRPSRCAKQCDMCGRPRSLSQDRGGVLVWLARDPWQARVCRWNYKAAVSARRSGRCCFLLTNLRAGLDAATRHVDRAVFDSARRVLWRLRNVSPCRAPLGGDRLRAVVVPTRARLAGRALVRGTRSSP